MICPACRTLVPDGLSICDSCNHILDASFLGDDILNEEERAAAKEAEATRIKAIAEVEKERDRTRILPADGAKSAKKSGAKKAPVPAPAAFPDEDENTASGLRKARLDEVAAPPAATNEAIDDLARQFRALPRSEKFSAVGAGLLLLSLALPWQSSKAQGDALGMLSSAWPLALVAGGIVAAMVLRRHPRLRGWRDRILQASAALSVIACLGVFAFMKSAVVLRTVREGRKVFTEASSWPAFGVYLGLLAAVLALAGAIMSWLDRERLAT